MTDALTTAYLGNLTKFRDDKGFLHVKGLATDGTLDLDQQIVDPIWAQKAMKEWFETGPNLREMHTASAVGKGVELITDDLGAYLTAKVVDTDAALKVDEGVYTGFSIGIKGAEVIKDENAPNGRITGGRIVEVSLVDRPANPSCSISVAKAAGIDIDEEIEKADAYKPKPYKADPDETVECPKCHRMNDTDAHYCDQCGFKLDGATDVEVKSADAEVTKSVTAKVGEALGEIVKAETHDPAQLQEMRSGFVSLINAELAELDSGSDDEIGDVYQLLSALSTFLSWWEDEADEGETTEPFQENEGDDTMAYIGLGVSADLIKSAGADDATPEVKSELRSEIVKALGLEEVPTLKAALGEATEQITLLKAELDSVKEMAQPSDVARRATQEHQSKAAQADQLDLLASQRQASAYSQTDPATAQQYLDAASALRAQAAGLRA